MESIEPQVEPTPNLSSAAAPKQYALRSIFNEAGFHIGFAEAQDGEVNATEFTMPQSLCYTNIDMAVSHLESVLSHARSVQLAAAYNAGLNAATQPKEMPEGLTQAELIDSLAE